MDATVAVHHGKANSNVAANGDPGVWTYFVPDEGMRAVMRPRIPTGFRPKAQVCPESLRGYPENAAQAEVFAPFCRAFCG